MTIYLEKIVKSYLFYIISAFGISLTIRASVGVSSFNSMNLAFANAFAIKVGTVTIIINSLFLVAYMWATEFKLKKKYVIQITSVLMFGTVINFFTYGVLGGLVIEPYVMRLLAITVGTSMGGLAVGMIVSYNVITFPVESVCMVISEKTRYSFTWTRYMVDVFSIAISLFISTYKGLPIYVREGTLISLLIFSFVVGRVKHWYQLKNEKKAAGLTLIQRPF
jgi:uncharacterized membrane protein YczE